jgi:hypothetical protein
VTPENNSSTLNLSKNPFLRRYMYGLLFLRHAKPRSRVHQLVNARPANRYRRYFAEVLSRKAVPKAYRIDRILKPCNRARPTIPSDEGKTIS